MWLNATFLSADRPIVSLSLRLSIVLFPLRIRGGRHVAALVFPFVHGSFRGFCVRVAESLPQGEMTAGGIERCPTGVEIRHDLVPFHVRNRSVPASGDAVGTLANTV